MLAPGRYRVTHHIPSSSYLILCFHVQLIMPFHLGEMSIIVVQQFDLVATKN